MHKHITERLTYRRVLQLIGLLIAGAIGLMWLRGDDIPIEGLEDQHESLLYLLGVGAGLVLWALTIFRPQWVKGILRRYGYPPDLQESATDLVLEQAELLAAQWAE